MANLPADLNFYMLRNLEKYEYYNATKRVQVQKRTGGSEVVLSARQRTGLVRSKVDSFRNKISPAYIRGREEVTRYLTNSIMSQAIKDALITGCSFLRISKDSDKIVIENIDSTLATGTMNTDGLLTEALSAVVDDYQIVGYDYYNLDSTLYSTGAHYVHNLGVCNLVPIVYNPNIKRKFGAGLVDKALRSDYETIVRNKYYQDEVVSEFAKNQRYLLGLNPTINSQENALAVDTTGIMGITKDADGQAPTAGQFSPQSPDALANAIEKIYSNSDRETNRADEAFAIRQAQLDFAECFTKALCVIQALQNNQPYVYYPDYTFIWKASEPVDFMKIAEGVQMVNNFAPGYFGKDQLDELLGLNGGVVETMDTGRVLEIANNLLENNNNNAT